ncbi:hypothetical protein [Oleiagrimonas sp. C23AA]|uniref:hypothetical protein n=1 Tax=Oleiagrimonas sp. C23AA TaxID=2719047 RepID=UPI0014212AF0|nr:hypothetical protein [Oleiagrimonas sp. C23AA]NII11288.1 hypothetical protein [Oleiagrimonas sp. C23AA]
MRLMTRLSLGLVLAAALAAPAAFAAPPAQQMADLKAVQNFQLNEGFLDKYLAAQDDIAKDPCNLSMIGVMSQGGKDMSLDKMVSMYQAQPGVKPMLARHNLTARQMVLGMAALMQAAAGQMQQEHPEYFKDHEAPAASAHNIAFLKAHRDEIQQHMQKLAKEQMASGHMPSCLKGKMGAMGGK